MSVKNTHRDYDAMAGKWKRCRDVASGQDAVHAAGADYLPMLKDQTKEDYLAYVTRASFYNATWRTIAGMLGMLYRKPPIIETPESIKSLLDDVTMGGVPLHVFVQDVAEEALKVGRVGILIDYPRVDVSNITQADAQRLNLRPSMCSYDAEQIINWRTGTINNQHVLTLVVLSEENSVEKNEFEIECETKYRVLDLNPETGAYRVRLFSINKFDEDALENEYTPLMNGRPLDYIPFVFIGTDDVSPYVDEPPLIDLVDVNLSHYRNSADYEHGCHFTGLPTAVVAGYTPPDQTPGKPQEKLYIGSGAAWVFPDPAAKAFYLEFTGQGLGALENMLARKEQQMAVLGARMLQNDKKAAEAAETAAIHRASENSVLSSIAQTLSIGITKALEIFCEWAGAEGVVKFELNRDFMPVGLSAQDITARLQLWQGGAISHTDLIAELKSGEIIDNDRTLDDVLSDIESEPPKLGAL